MRLGILGAGPAGHLAALAGQAAGARVGWWGGGPGVPQSGHVHLLRAGLTAELARIDPALGAAAAAARDPAHRWIDAQGRTRPAPRLTRAGLEGVLARACAAAGLAPAQGPPPDPSGADLWIDATGGARALARAWQDQGLGDLTLDDIGAAQFWQTWVWEAALPGAPFTLVLPGRLYLEAEAHRTRATGPEGRWPDPPAPLSLPPGPPDHRLRLAGPPVRQARWAGDRRLLLLGDARLQTPTSMGFGLFGAAQQAVLLARALRAGDDPEPALADWADGLWMGAGMQAALGA